MDISPSNCAAIRDYIHTVMSQEHMKAIAQIDALPSDKDLAFIPHEKAMPFFQLLLHSYACGPFFCNTVDGKGTEEPAEPKTRAELKATCEKLHQDYLKRLKALTPEQLSKKYDFFGMGMYPGLVHVEVHVRHFIHHRGQAQTYLRILGAKCPPIYGPTADVSFEQLAEMAAAKP